jgi:hypothetical protein
VHVQVVAVFYSISWLEKIITVFIVPDRMDSLAWVRDRFIMSRSDIRRQSDVKAHFRTAMDRDVATLILAARI